MTSPSLGSRLPSIKSFSKRLDPEEVDRRLERAAVPVKVFTLLCQHNSDVQRQDTDRRLLTYYHTTEEPTITLAAYVERLCRYGNSGIESILIGLRLAGRCHATSGITLTRLSAHRLIISAMTLGVKATTDLFCNNRVIARAGVIQHSELNSLEIKFFRDIGYRAVVRIEELEHMEQRCAAAMELFEQNRLTDFVRAATEAFCGTVTTDGDPLSTADLGIKADDEDCNSSALSRAESAASLQSLQHEDSPESLYRPSLEKHGSAFCSGPYSVTSIDTIATELTDNGSFTQIPSLSAVSSSAGWAGSVVRNRRRPALASLMGSVLEAPIDAPMNSLVRPSAKVRRLRSIVIAERSLEVSHDDLLEETA
jgi:hypothetical protein